MAQNPRMAEEKERRSSGNSTPSLQSPVTDDKKLFRDESISSQDSREEIIDVEEYDVFTAPIEVTVSRKSHRHPAELSRAVTGVSMATTHTREPNFEVDFETDDPNNPKNWPRWKLCSSFFVITFSTLTVVLYSTSYTTSIPGMMETFGVSQTIGILGLTTYLLGLAAGSVVLAPLSEMYGRRPVYIISMALFALLILPCALARNIESILVTRFFGAFCGCVMISNAPGSISDLVKEEYRALAFSVFALGPMNGPVFGPLLGGWTAGMGWRWTNWIVLILAGVSFTAICCVPETYAPQILRQRAAEKRKETGDERWWSRYDEKKGVIPLLKTNLNRPFVMSFTEPICIFWNLYISVVYAILYLCFVAYPIVFGQLRHWSPGLVGLSYLGIGAGTLITIGLEPLYRRMINAHPRDPVTSRPAPEAMVSVVCIAAICVPVGEMIFAWTCTPDVHWIAPILAGVPFGAGNTACFIYASSYLANSYEIYAASALAGNSVLRSLLGGTLPLAGPSMYASLGPHYAGLLLSLLEFAIVPIPFVFYKYGDRIRKKSSLIAAMQADQARLNGKRKPIKLPGNAQGPGEEPDRDGAGDILEGKSYREKQFLDV